MVILRKQTQIQVNYSHFSNLKENAFTQHITHQTLTKQIVIFRIKKYCVFTNREPRLSALVHANIP